MQKFTQWTALGMEIELKKKLTEGLISLRPSHAYATVRWVIIIQRI